jgi:hypothetical protein
MSVLLTELSGAVLGYSKRIRQPFTHSSGQITRMGNQSAWSCLKGGNGGKLKGFRLPSIRVRGHSLM